MEEHSNDLKPIPGYEGVYWISSDGSVMNRFKHRLKSISTGNGPAVELRKDGQRELVLLQDILKQEVKDEDFRATKSGT